MQLCYRDISVSLFTAQTRLEMDLEETYKEEENTERTVTRAAAAKLVKKAFLEALKCNDFETLEDRKSVV